MKTQKRLLSAIWMLLVVCPAISQITQGVYHSTVGDTHHELKISNNYLIHSVYKKEPAEFIKTLGGFYSIDGENLKVKLEFNSAYKDDGITELNLPFSSKDGTLTLKELKLVFTASEESLQDLDGAWLFATRGPDTGQKRRGDQNPRKTLKFLKDERFQWIAYNVESMEFFGTGGGAFTSKDGAYVENIEYFSRDNSRVGASLKFDYEVKGKDWHHKGLNSKGEPMYEIWSKRTTQR